MISGKVQKKICEILKKFNTQMTVRQITTELVWEIDADHKKVRGSLLTLINKGFVVKTTENILQYYELIKKIE